MRLARVQPSKPLDSQSVGFSRFKDESEVPTSDFCRLKGAQGPSRSIIWMDRDLAPTVTRPCWVSLR